MHSVPGSRFGSRARRSLVAGATAIVTAAALLWACGGTTGHQGDGLGSSGNSENTDATVLADANTDGGAASYDAGLFDVDIIYANRPLPEAAAPSEGGADAGASYPNCPPWLPVDQMGNLLDAASDPSVVNFVPAYYVDDAGDVAPAETFTIAPSGDLNPGVPVPAAGACAAYDWFPQINSNCAIDVNYISGVEPYAPDPPCNWARDLGNATAGPGAGESRYDLCMAVYSCIQQTACWRGGPGEPFIDTYCFCGPLGDGGDSCVTQGVAAGPCAAPIQAAWEFPNLTPGIVHLILNHYATDLDLNCPADIPMVTAPCYVQPLMMEYTLAAAKNIYDGRTQTCLILDAGAD